MSVPRTNGRERQAVAGLVVMGVLAALLTLGPVEGVRVNPLLDAHGSVNQVWAVDLVPGAAVELLDSADVVVATATTDSQGAILFRGVAAGGGYRVRQGPDLSDPLAVLSSTDHPTAGFYEGITIPHRLRIFAHP
jgi:hypothetical protein